MCSLNPYLAKIRKQFFNLCQLLRDQKKKRENITGLRHRLGSAKYNEWNQDTFLGFFFTEQAKTVKCEHFVAVDVDANVDFMRN